MKSYLTTSYCQLPTAPMKRFLLLLLVLAPLTQACKPKVQRVDPNSVTDRSGSWNSTDARLVAEEMIPSVFYSPWYERHQAATGKIPVVIVGPVRNKSHEHIDAEEFTKELEKEFIRTGKVRVVQDPEFRAKLRQERAEQHEFASEATIKQWGREVGADYMLFTVISSTVDPGKKDRVVTYKISQELASVETNEKVWLDSKEIKKIVRN